MTRKRSSAFGISPILIAEIAVDILSASVMNDERFDDGGKLLLLAARELRGGFKKLFILPVGPVPRFLVPFEPTKSSTETLRASARPSS